MAVSTAKFTTSNLATDYIFSTLTGIWIER